STFFFFNTTPTTEIYTLSLHDALPISVNFIVNSCDEAAKNLPNTYESRYRGRIVKGAALALKARTLLYAASPLYNSNEPYVPVADRKSTRLNSSHVKISYAVFCLKKKK